MERLTSHCGAINDGNTYYPKSNFVTGNLFQQILNTLGKYENTELTPEEIEQNKEYIQILEKENKLIKEQYIKEADTVDCYKKLATENAKLKELLKLAIEDMNDGHLCFKCGANCNDKGLDDSQCEFISQCGCFKWQHADKLRGLGVEE